MQFGGDILAQFARALGRQEEPGDFQITIPPVLVPSILLCKPIPNRFETTPAAPGVENSFFSTLTVVQGASAAQVATSLGVFSRGLWLVHVHFSFLQSFTNAMTGDADNIIRLLDPANNAVALDSRFGAANVPQGNDAWHVFMFPEDDFDLQLLTAATGAAQTRSSQASCQALRLV